MLVLFLDFYAFCSLMLQYFPDKKRIRLGTLRLDDDQISIYGTLINKFLWNDSLMKLNIR